MKITITLLLIFMSPFIYAQVIGVITDKNKEPLPFVNVYLKSNSRGTTTNNEGNYLFNLKKTGNYTLIFQYLGYKTVTKKTMIEHFPYQLNISRLENTVSLNEVLVSSKENPAHKIIRSAMANRKKNKLKLENFTADFYSRGIFRIKDAPEKII